MSHKDATGPDPSQIPTADPGPITDPVPGPGSVPAAPPEPGDSPAHHGGYEELEKIKHSLSARMWTGLIIGALVLIVLLVFVIQNPDSTEFQIFGWHFSIPLGVAILLAAIGGALVTAIVAGLRMFQLRRAAKRAHR